MNSLPISAILQTLVDTVELLTQLKQNAGPTQGRAITAMISRLNALGEVIAASRKTK